MRDPDGILRKYDIAVTAPDGTVFGVEVKSGTAVRTAQQRAVDEALTNAGGFDTVGQNAVDASISRISKVGLIEVDESGTIISSTLP